MRVPTSDGRVARNGTLFQSFESQPSELGPYSRNNGSGQFDSASGNWHHLPHSSSGRTAHSQ